MTAKLFRFGLGALLASLTVIGIQLGPESVGTASAASPAFADPYADGLITFCSQSGQVLTSGSILAQPFVWNAVSTVTAPMGFAKGLAYLLAYQPLQYVDPGDWSGEQMNDGSWFADAANPTAAATNRDTPMLWFVQAYPPHWDGLVELRMYYSATGSEPYTDKYPIAIIKVHGDTWKLVEGGSGPCTSGKTETLESQMSPGARLTTPNEVALGPAKPKTSGPSTTVRGTPTSKSTIKPTSPGPGSQPTDRLAIGAQAQSDSSAGGGGLSGVAIALITAGAVVVAGVGGGLLWRRRSSQASVG